MGNTSTAECPGRDGPLTCTQGPGAAPKRGGGRPRDPARRSDGTSLVFPTPRRKPRCDATLSQLIKELGIAAVPHGFRSSFRDWPADSGTIEPNRPRRTFLYFL